MSLFTEDEIGQVQACLARKIELNEDDWEALRQVAPQQLPHAMAFLPLYLRNRDLYDKLAQNSRVKRYGPIAFFPETIDTLLGDGEPTLNPRIAQSENRGLIYLWDLPQGKRIIKPLQNTRENRVAEIASELIVSPKQYATIDGFLTEEFLEGVLFPNLPAEKQGEESMYNLGRRMAQVLKALHGRNICYNDTTLSDDMGKSHLVVPSEGLARLLDFGAAIDLSNHPDLSDEEVFLYARTLPSVNVKVAMGMRMGRQKEVFEELVSEYRPQLKQLGKEEILARDEQFVREGLWVASMRMPCAGLNAFGRGFAEAYS